MRLVNIDELSKMMYHEAFETDSDMQKWDGGCWIRYKLFEKCRDSVPVVDAIPAEKIADIVEGTIDHLNRDDALDMLYQIKDVLARR